ncbi:MAG: 4-hydroxy-3-methylbut-2-enyl diphosphate reductase [Candidatus Omnitrophota bacterium]
MQITIAKSSGFCFGVRRAINIGKRITRSRKNVYILGDIVHNNFVVRQLSACGLKRIRRLAPQRTKDAVLIISAHGAPKKTFLRARALGYKIVNATCPKVREIYKIGRDLEKTNRIIIIGDRNHEEVRGIAGQLKQKPLTIQSPADIPKRIPNPGLKTAVLTQSTQSRENIQKIMSRLRRAMPAAKLYNTVCRTTRIKQKEIKTLPRQNDIVIIVGSASSANTRRLYEISREINKKTYRIETAEELKRKWLKGTNKVGIMAGASTPDVIVKEVIERINRYPAAKLRGML